MTHTTVDRDLDAAAAAYNARLQQLMLLHPESKDLFSDLDFLVGSYVIRAIDKGAQDGPAEDHDEERLSNRITSLEHTVAEVLAQLRAEGESR